jgi:hypothetical protein
VQTTTVNQSIIWVIMRDVWRPHSIAYMYNLFI